MITISPSNWSKRIMGTYQPITSINGVMMKAAASSLVRNVKSSSSAVVRYLDVVRRRNPADALIMFARPPLSAGIMTLSDIITSVRLWSKRVFISNFSVIKGCPWNPSNVSLKAIAYISWSPKCFFLWQPLLFLVPLFHLSDCLSFSFPPQPASVMLSPSLFVFYPSFCLPLSF